MQKQSFMLFHSLHKQYDYAISMMAYAWGLKMQKQYAEAIRYYKKSLSIVEAEHYSYGIGNVQNNLSEVYYELGN